VRIVEESLGGRGLVAETARGHDVGRTSPVRRRRQYRDGRLTRDGVRPGFTQLTIAAPDEPEVPGVPFTPEPPAARTRVADIALVNGRRLSVPTTIDPVMPARLLHAPDLS